MYTRDDLMAKHSRALGKAQASLLATLASQDKTIFTVPDAQKVTGTSIHATTLMLNALVKKKWLIRLVAGKYLIVPLSAGEEGEYSENWYVVAKYLIEPKPYYLSHYSALDIHEMTTQPALTVYISTPTRRIPKEVLGASFRFVYAKSEDIWGVENVWATPNQQVNVSDLERTIIDCLDRPSLCGGIIEPARGLWAKRNDIDYEKLVAYAKRLGRRSVAKRLGFLLDVLGIGTPEALAVLRGMVTASYTLLDPSLPTSGRYVSSWKVRANVDPEELRAATTT